jgi:predicted patatin/cPLA2 family phospholipase
VEVTNSEEQEHRLVEIIRVLKEKKKNPAAPHRVWLLVGGGSLNGAYTAGVQMALVEAGLNHTFTGVIGVSTGIPALGYLLSNKPYDVVTMRESVKVYSEEARSRLFLKRWWRMDMQWLVEVFRGSTGRPIIFDNVQKSGVKFVGVVTDAEFGRPLYITPHDSEDMYAMIGAGCSVPVSARPFPFRSGFGVDSAVSDPCPVPWLMTQHKDERPTHIIIIANVWREPPSYRKQIREWFLIKRFFSKRTKKQFISHFALRHRKFYRGVELALRRTDVQIAVDWLPNPQRPLERNQKKIAALTEAGYQRFKALLEAGDR